MLELNLPDCNLNTCLLLSPPWSLTIPLCFAAAFGCSVLGCLQTTPERSRREDVLLAWELHNLKKKKRVFFFWLLKRYTRVSSAGATG